MSSTQGRDRSPISDTILKIVRSMSVPVKALHVTPMGAYRSDAHVGPWGDNPSVPDCSHWCLPGVPDTWNEIVFSYLLHKDGVPSQQSASWRCIYFVVLFWNLWSSLLSVGTVWLLFITQDLVDKPSWLPCFLENRSLLIYVLYIYNPTEADFSYATGQELQMNLHQPSWKRLGILEIIFTWWLLCIQAPDRKPNQKWKNKSSEGVMTS